MAEFGHNIAVLVTFSYLSSKIMPFNHKCLLLTEFCSNFAALFRKSRNSSAVESCQSAKASASA